MRRIALGIVLAGSLALFQPAQAKVATINFQLKSFGDFVALCSVRADDPDAMAAIHMCHGFLVGVARFHDLFSRSTGNGIYCIAAGQEPSRDDAVEMILAWSKENPDKLTAAPVDGVLIWAAETFPCEQ